MPFLSLSSLRDLLLSDVPEPGAVAEPSLPEVHSPSPWALAGLKMAAEGPSPPAVLKRVRLVLATAGSTSDGSQPAVFNPAGSKHARAAIAKAEEGFEADDEAASQLIGTRREFVIRAAEVEPRAVPRAPHVAYKAWIDAVMAERGGVYAVARGDHHGLHAFFYARALDLPNAPCLEVCCARSCAARMIRWHRSHNLRGAVPR